jgi:hypothetical protein
MRTDLCPQARNVALFEFVEIRSRQAWSQIVFPPVPSSNVVVLGFHIEVIIHL